MQAFDQTSDLPLGGHQVIRTSDLDEALQFAEEAFSPMRADLGRVVGPAEFQLNSVTLGRTVLTAHEQFLSGGGATFLVETDPTYHHIEIPLVGAGRVTIGSEVVNLAAGRTAVIAPPGRRALWEDDGLRFRAAGLQIDRGQLQRRFDLLVGTSRDCEIEFAPKVDLRSPAGGSFCHAALTPFYSMAEGSSIFDNEITAVLFEDFLIQALLSSFEHSSSGILSTAPALASVRQVREAEAYFHAHADEPLTITDVAEKIGVSVRSLQRTFQQELGLTPMRLLKTIRLERTRVRLMSGEPNANVTQIALTSGFSHLGAFAADYKKRFGESPSETLRRSG